ncbi:MAG TPA: hypothetical protein VNA15_04280 [Candidatus Angelobacter sp.]|nr:hypothetical protein [Candidatus Angelobacter sp.]
MLRTSDYHLKIRVADGSLILYGVKPFTPIYGINFNYDNGYPQLNLTPETRRWLHRVLVGPPILCDGLRLLVPVRIEALPIAGPLQQKDRTESSMPTVCQNTL